MIEKRQRKSIRLKEFDYSQPGEYFVTICTKNHNCIFGSIVSGKMDLNDRGKIVDRCWKGILEHFSNVELDEYVVMPNHIHGILILNESVVGTRHAVSLPERFGRPVSDSVSTIVRSFKSAVTKRINEMHLTGDAQFWQPRYYDRIIRSENELQNIRDYIANNVVTWAFDKENPEDVPLFLQSEK
ncbi:MAG: transposase [Ignavibacteriales bacterium]|nr:transposase [Ignavibacteriales bacterium]